MNKESLCPGLISSKRAIQHRARVPSAVAQEGRRIVTIFGLVGGIAPESTIDYYRQIIAEYRKTDSEGGHPLILITSVDLHRTIRLLNASRYDELADILVTEIARLERAGAAFAAIASNTAHIVFEEVAKRSTLPLMSIVEVTCAAAKNQGIRRPALFGTRFLMNAPFYAEIFALAGLRVVLPTTADQDA
ncbi:MAG TPA: amino acid racemase, partial [Blastocatellia bacterium]|nr:amino acid racemase [Blastocatellia bacterium]